jgi:hypothetical protein
MDRSIDQGRPASILKNVYVNNKNRDSALSSKHDEELSAVKRQNGSKLVRVSESSRHLQSSSRLGTASKSKP